MSEAIWSNHHPVPSTPEGFTVRGTLPKDADGVEVMLERWEAGTSEPPHSHPGDDMTVVVEGRMVIRFYVRQGGKLVQDGDELVLAAPSVGYVAAGRIHDARYIEACKLVYVHDKAFAFVDEG